jgi:hypothetical protein
VLTCVAATKKKQKERLEQSKKESKARVEEEKQRKNEETKRPRVKQR